MQKIITATATVSVLLLLILSCQKETGFRKLPEDVLLFFPSPPDVATDSVIASSLPATFYATIATMGSDSLSRYGFCFSSVKTEPTIADSVVESSIKVEGFPFSYHLTTSMLKRDTAYYVRAFAENKRGIAYSETVISFVVPDNKTLPRIATDDIENITASSANIKATILDDGNAPITAYGVCYSNVDQDPDLSSQVAITGTSTSTSFPFGFAQTIQSLSNANTYYVRAFATNSVGTMYGTTKSFKTNAPVAVKPTVQTYNVINITAIGATVDGAIVAAGTENITRFGFCLSTTNANPTTADVVIVSGTTSPTEFPFPFAERPNNLIQNTTYYVRAFATSSAGTSYGVSRSFKTISNITTPPTVITTDVLSTSITTTSVTARGTIEAVGTSPITRYGFCYSSTDRNPSIASDLLVVGTASPPTLPLSFSGTINTLQPGTQYFVRAFATNNVGTTYGVSKSFRTVALPTAPPTVQTVNVSGVGAFAANVIGNITAQGTSNVSEYGVVYSASNANPTTADSKVVAGTSAASVPLGFAAALTSLAANTTYSARAYAISAAGTAYGDSKRFTTLIATPTVTTDQATFNEPSSSISVRGTIQSRGASAITRYGFCYSAINSNPDINDNVTDIGTTVTASFPFSFSGSLVRLPAGSYFIRAYAFNASGVTYGNIVVVRVFVRPIVSTEGTTGKDAGAGIETLLANITSGGSSPIQEYGFCFIPTADIGRGGFNIGDANVAVVRRSTPVPTAFPYRYLLDVTVSYNVDYSYKAYVKTANGYWYGSVKTFYISYKP